MYSGRASGPLVLVSAREQGCRNLDLASEGEGEGCWRFGRLGGIGNGLRGEEPKRAAFTAQVSGYRKRIVCGRLQETPSYRGWSSLHGLC